MGEDRADDLLGKLVSRRVRGGHWSVAIGVVVLDVSVYYALLKALALDDAGRF